MIRTICKFTFYFILLVTAVRKTDGVACPEKYQYQRPVACPDNKYMHFVLFSRSNPTDGQTLDVAADNITDSNFNAANPTKIIIHAQLETISEPHYVDMRAEYLKKGEYNLIMVDWDDLAYGDATCFGISLGWTSHVGECTGGLIQRLRKNHDMTDVHVVGFGLGAVTIHYVAEHVDPRLPRATGLDPSETRQSGEPVPSLSKSNADFLDVIHSNYMGRQPMGRYNSVGHVDFYMNNGIKQPGCEVTSKDPDGKICSQTRALLYYIESINSETGFYGSKCTIPKVRRNTCSLEKLDILMGDGVLTTSKGIVAVPTAAQSPFALGRKD